MMRPAVFLDRDGVVNRTFIRDGTPYPPVSLQDLEILPDVPEALSAMKARGYSLVVVTNQPDVARDTSSRELVDRIHSPHFGVNYDPSNTILAGEDPLELLRQIGRASCRERVLPTV